VLRQSHASTEQIKLGFSHVTVCAYYLGSPLKAGLKNELGRETACELRVNISPHKFILVKPEGLAVSRQAAQKFDMGRFSLKKSNSGFAVWKTQMSMET
jgi:hypothetical protein